MKILQKTMHLLFQSLYSFFSTRFFSLARRFSPPTVLLPKKTPMLRRGAAVLLRRGARSFADDAAAAAAGDASAEISRRTFLEKFAPLVSSTTAPPSFPTDFLPKEKAEETAATAGVPDKLKFSFYLPHGQPMDRQPVRKRMFFFPLSFLRLRRRPRELDAVLRFSDTSDALSLQLSSPTHAAARAPAKGGNRERKRVGRRAGLRSESGRREQTLLARFRSFPRWGATPCGGGRRPTLSSRSHVLACALSLLSPASALGRERERERERERVGELRTYKNEKETDAEASERER